MHYAEFKIHAPKVLRALIENFPFAAIMVNGPDAPIVARAPLTFRPITSNGAIDFHLANENPISPFLKNGVPVTIAINGPGAHISASWYKTGTADKDHSKLVSTYDYITATLQGKIEALTTEQLSQQIADLVNQQESTVENHWNLEEIDPEFFVRLRSHISGYRMVIESFDFTAKISQDKDNAVKPGIIKGLRARGLQEDIILADIIALYNGTPESLFEGLQISRKL